MPSLDGALMESLLVQPGRRGARVGHGRRSLAAVSPARQVVRRGGQGQLRLPDSLEVSKVSLNLNSGNGLCQICRRTPQFDVVVLSFGAGIAAKAGQPAIGTTIGVQHQNYTFRPMQADGRADLVQNKLTVCFVFWGRQALGPSSNLDGVRIKHKDSLEELPKSQFEAVIETPDNGRVRMIFFSRRGALEDFPHLVAKCYAPRKGKAMKMSSRSSRVHEWT